MKKFLFMIAMILCITSNAYATGCGVSIRRTVSYNNAIAYQAPVVVQQVVPAVVLPVLASHGNLVAGQPFVLDQTIAQINTGVYGNYGIVNTLVPQVNITALTTRTNQVLANSNKNVNNTIAGRKAASVTNTTTSNVIVRQRVINGNR